MLEVFPPFDTEEVAADGRTPNRGGYRHFAADKINRMREMILMGNSTTQDIALAAEVSNNHVQLERNRMLANAGSS
jgi:hypothetical protein